MKKILMLIPVIISIIAIMSYAMLGDVPADAPGPTAAEGPVEADIWENHIPIPQNVASANNEFALGFYGRISQDEENVFFSPVSMYAAFAALYEGAKGNTADEIRQVFGFEANHTARHNATAQMLASVGQDDPYATLGMANALWIADWFEPYDEYLEVSRETYMARAENINFEDTENAAARINAWALEETDGLIEDVVKPENLDPSTTMAITNSIYFDGEWGMPFPADDTKKADFWKSDTESVSVDFMHVTGAFNYAQYGDIAAVELPYAGGRLSMLVILPEDIDGITSLEEGPRLAELLANWSQGYGQEMEVVAIPKFTLNTSYDLKRPLVELGMADAFDETRAVLSGVGPTPGRPYVSAATQSAFIDVNEEGTEAAATTLVVIMALGDPPPEPPRFIADHPFLFIIRDNESGMILFMGRISDPSLP